MRALAFLAVVCLPLEAAAFCRTTTCKGPDCKKDAEGCPADGIPLYWETRCIGYSLQRSLSQNLDPEGTRTAVRRAFEAWSVVDCGGGKIASLTFSPQDDVLCKTSEYRQGGPNVNVVMFQDDDWIYKDLDNTLAKTTVSFNPATGQIMDADIEVNTAANLVSVGTEGVTYDLQSILTHEVGHLIGLAHSSHGAATMFASYEPGTTALRTLEADDIAAVCAVYPPDRDAACDSEPYGGQADDCDQRVNGCNALGEAPIIGLILVLFLRRRA